MKTKYKITSLLFLFLNLMSLHSQREILDFNADWKFTLEDNPEFSKSAFDTSGWNTVQVPHDWAFEKGISKDGAQGASGGYFDGGIGWYQKSIEVPKEWDKKRITIEFDGVYMNSEIWVNGQSIGKRPYGYISFRYEISKFLKPGKNTITVRVDNTLENSARWYHPCGMYAPVRLLVTDNIYIPPHGVFITTPDIGTEQALLNIETSFGNTSTASRKAILETFVKDKEGVIVGNSKQAFSSEKNAFLQVIDTIKIDNPKLWSPDFPYLYTVVSQIRIKNKIVDQVETIIGIRDIEWKTESGFWLNDKNIKLLGVSEHYEGGPIGGAWTKPMMRWKLSLLKEMGVNAIRTAHNPAPPLFYDLCDEMGILVMDEIFDGWQKKAKEDYGKQAFVDWWERDMTEWLMRNRNHPSIIIYSVGNETKGEIGKELVALGHRLDPNKPITSGHSASEYMDIYGVNGGSEKQGFFNSERPDKPFVATEAPHTWQTRGYYRTKTWYRDGYPNKRQQPFELPDLTENEVFNYEWAPSDIWVNGKQHFNSSYDNAMVRVSARKNWELMRDLPWFSGHFRWTGFDYYGEASYVHGGWPFRLFMGGALDVAGFKKDLFYFYKSQWTTKPMVHILPHWTHPTLEKGTKIPVWVYSNCDEVELFLNGHSLGKDIPGIEWDKMQCEWSVPWEAGTLTAKGYIDGKEVAIATQTSAQNPSQLQQELENKYISATKNQSAIVTTKLVDLRGVFYPYGENKVYYHIKGDAKIVSLENGDPVDTTKNVGVHHKKAFMGATRAFLRLGKIAKNVRLVTGAILGEKQQLTSNLVSIAINETSIVGEHEKYPFTIYYTLDGSTPTLTSNRYMDSFPVTLGTTVKALVMSNGEKLFLMEEQFDKNSGLYWGSKDTTQKSTNGMLAINADFKGAVPEIVDGKKYLDFKVKEGKVTWYQENDGSAGLFKLKISYASNDSKSIPMELFINNKSTGTVTFKPTGTSNASWTELITEQKLEAGANYIELKTKGKSGPNLFMLTVE